MSPLLVVGIPILALGLTLTAVTWLRPRNADTEESVISLGWALVGAWLVGAGT